MTKKLLLIATLGFTAFVLVNLTLPPRLEWQDRRPIGALFLASNAHVSSTNPRGWLNDKSIDIGSSEGRAQFRAALFKQVATSIDNLRLADAQGVIVWNLEGEAFPHEITYIGDPRLLPSLAPEMDELADELFRRFREAGMRTGVTIRPQQFTPGQEGELPQQNHVFGYDKLLLDKIRYARKRWGATLFYIDSNGGVLWPDEVLRLGRVAQAEPGVLLIPQHQQPLHHCCSAPYDSTRHGASGTAAIIRKLFPRAFTVLDVSDLDRGRFEEVRAAAKAGDVLLFRTWFNSPELGLVRSPKGE